jgi:aspartyl-tRNA(Asn)/glutamyl-tRNA(Gln) amidotransferase subunit B
MVAALAMMIYGVGQTWHLVDGLFFAAERLHGEEALLHAIEIVEKRGMKQVTDLGAIEKVVDEIITANPEQVEKVKAKPTMIGWFVGQAMKASGGKANPQALNEILKKKLGLD